MDRRYEISLAYAKGQLDAGAKSARILYPLDERWDNIIVPVGDGTFLTMHDGDSCGIEDSLEDAVYWCVYGRHRW